jgi:hypothetical protein
MTKPHSDESLDAFLAARAQLRRSGLSDNMKGLFSPATLARLQREEDTYPAESFSPSIRDRLVWVMGSPDDHGLYGGIETRMGGSALGRQIIQEHFIGDYALFRYAKAPHPWMQGELGGQRETIGAQGMNLKFVEERITISFDAFDEPAFAYRGADWSEAEDDPEISGAAFYSVGKLFLAGTAQDSMSMAIFQVPTMSGPFHGFWMSMMPTGLRAPFSARVLLVPLDRDARTDALLERLRASNGHEEFFHTTQGDYAFYMTID